VDISGHRSKLVSELDVDTFDYVVTVCDHASEHCPFFPAESRRIHAGFPDPPALARTAATHEEALEHYRRVRDAIRDFVQSLPAPLL
jgi:arsenate reductase